MEPFIGQLMPFAGNFAPRGWAQCNGQLLPISQNQALFSIVGTMYGGDGRTTFGLPDFRGRVPIHMGTGPGLSAYSEGQKGGVETVTLNTTQIPAHNHTVECQDAQGTLGTPAGNFLAADRDGADDVYSATSDTQMAGAVVNNTGGGQAHENRMPFQVVNWCIALVGIFPSRN